MNIMDQLVDFMNKTVKRCAGISATTGKDQCINDSIIEFNKDISSSYVNSGIDMQLTRDCESSPQEKSADWTVENIEDCASTDDVNCQCSLPNIQSSIMLHLESSDESTIFTFKGDNNAKSFNIESYQTFLNDKNSAIASADINLNSLKIFKTADGLKIGSQFQRSCQPLKNKFKLCLKSGYTTSVFENNKLVDKDIIIRFAVLIRDNAPPAPITGLELYNKLHSQNDVMVTWTPGIEKDIVRYVLYLGDSQSDFATSTDAIRQKLSNYRGLNIPNKEYEVYKDIRISDEPECFLANDSSNKPYCKFLYMAIDKDGNNVKIELSDNKLYYLSAQNKFLYILDGKDESNKLSDNKNKFIAVTAIDSDGNEINNTKADEKIELNKNLKQILVKDLLEPGFINFAYEIKPVEDGEKISVSWDKPANFIDGTKISAVDVDYNLYLLLGNCQDNELNDLTKALKPDQSTKNLAADIKVAKPPAGVRLDYCLYVISELSGKQYMKGFAKKVLVQ